MSSDKEAPDGLWGAMGSWLNEGVLFARIIAKCTQTTPSCRFEILDEDRQAIIRLTQSIVEDGDEVKEILGVIATESTDGNRKYPILSEDENLCLIDAIHRYFRVSPHYRFILTTLSDLSKEESLDGIIEDALSAVWSGLTLLDCSDQDIREIDPM